MPPISYADVPSWAQWLIIFTILAAFVMTFLAMLRKLWPVLTNAVHRRQAMDNLPQFMVTTAASLAAQDNQIAEIHHENTANNGSSMKDSMRRLEKGQSEILDAQTRFQVAVELVSSRMDVGDSERSQFRIDIDQIRANENKPKDQL